MSIGAYLVGHALKSSSCSHGCVCVCVCGSWFIEFKNFYACRSSCAGLAVSINQVSVGGHDACERARGEFCEPVDLYKQ